MKILAFKKEESYNFDNVELRKFKRYPFREHILIDGVQRVTSTDISEEGLYISAIQYFEENSVIHISIPFKEKKITVKGQVKYSQAGVGIGIKFIDLNNEQRALIKALIKSIVL